MAASKVAEEANNGLADTVRFQVKPEFMGSITLENIVEELIFRVLKLQVQDVEALQEFRKQGWYDMTLANESSCLNVMQIFARSNAAIVSKVKLVPLFKRVKRVIFVHMYNIRVSNELVRQYLLRYCEEVDAGVFLRNKYKMKNGKRKFIVRFKRDEHSLLGYLCPPSNFAIGEHRGFCHFEGQPFYCRNCARYGHIQEHCDKPKGVCRRCGSGDHQMAQCEQARVCDLCGKAGHFVRSCPGQLEIVAREVLAWQHKQEQVGLNGEESGVGLREGAQGDGGTSVASRDLRAPDPPVQVGVVETVVGTAVVEPPCVGGGGGVDHMEVVPGIEQTPDAPGDAQAVLDMGEVIEGMLFDMPQEELALSPVSLPDLSEGEVDGSIPLGQKGQKERASGKNSSSTDGGLVKRARFEHENRFALLSEDSIPSYSGSGGAVSSPGSPVVDYLDREQVEEFKQANLFK